MPEAIGRGVGVAVLDLDVGDREAQLLGDDLGERRLVALALRLDADPGEDLARRVDPDLARVEHLQAEDVEVVGRPGADDLRERADADAHQLAALARFSACSRRRSVVADHVHRQLERGRVVARVVLPAGRRLVRELVGLDEVLHPELRPDPCRCSWARMSTIRSMAWTASVTRNEQRYATPPGGLFV